MKVIFHESFTRDLELVKDAGVRSRVRKVIERVEACRTFTEIPHIKKLAGAKDMFRIRIGDYRIGVVVMGSTVSFVRILHRKNIYRYFS